jgi:hypothetical protein
LFSRSFSEKELQKWSNWLKPNGRHPFLELVNDTRSHHGIHEKARIVLRFGELSQKHVVHERKGEGVVDGETFYGMD